MPDLCLDAAEAIEGSLGSVTPIDPVQAQIDRMALW
jgi:hypothetical protein